MADVFCLQLGEAMSHPWLGALAKEHLQAWGSPDHFTNMKVPDLLAHWQMP
jgi:hypothetical protein